MKINFEMSGGFAHVPALGGPFTIDTSQIDQPAAEQLESLVRESHFFNQPVQAGIKAKGAADYRAYNITVEDGERVHTIRLTDPVTDSTLARLVSQLRTIARSSTP